MEILTHPRYGYRELRVKPTAAELRRRYREEFYSQDKPEYLERYAQELPYWCRMWSLRLDAMAARLGAPGHLLDVGAGGGFFRHCAVERGWTTAGIEPSEAACRFARERYGLDQQPLFMEEFPDGEGSFDALHMAMVLEHVADPEATIQHAFRLLRRGGVLWVEVPNDFNPLQDAICGAMDKSPWWIVPEHHLNYFDYDSLTRLLEGYGGQVQERVASFPMELFPLMGMDYIGDDEIGRQAHTYRMNLERRLLEQRPETLLDLYHALAACGLGRTCNVMAVKV